MVFVFTVVFAKRTSTRIELFVDVDFTITVAMYKDLFMLNLYQDKMWHSIFKVSRTLLLLDWDQILHERVSLNAYSAMSEQEVQPSTIVH